MKNRKLTFLLGGILLASALPAHALVCPELTEANVKYTARHASITYNEQRGTNLFYQWNSLNYPIESLPTQFIPTSNDANQKLECHYTVHFRPTDPTATWKIELVWINGITAPPSLPEAQDLFDKFVKHESATFTSPSSPVKWTVDFITPRPRAIETITHVHFNTPNATVMSVSQGVANVSFNMQFGTLTGQLYTINLKGKYTPH